MAVISERHRGWFYDNVNAVFGASLSSVLPNSNGLLDASLTQTSAAVAANTALARVFIGTPVTAATPADSIQLSNLVASGDIAMFLNDGSGNSWEWDRFDASAGLRVFNEASSDIDFRVEGDNNASMLIIDAGLDALSHGAALVTGAFMTISPYAQTRNYVTSVGLGMHIPAGTQTDGGATRTVAIAAANFHGAATFTNASNTVTTTDLVGLYQAVPVASTGITATATRTYGIWSTGQIRADSNFQVNNVTVFGTTQPTGAVVFQSRTAPVGTIATGSAIFTDGTAMRKIIADGTASNIET